MRIRDVKEPELKNYFSFCKFVLTSFGELIDLGLSRRVVLKDHHYHRKRSKEITKMLKGLKDK